MDGLNISNGTCSDTDIHIAISILKFLSGLITIFLFIAVLSSLPLCKSLGYSSKMLLVTFYLLNTISYLLMTFYSPFVSCGYICLKNDFIIKIVAVCYQFPAFGLHITQSVISVDRLVALRFKSRQKVLFSRTRTRMLIACIILYAAVLASSSFLYCCTVIYDPHLQVWYYPYDEKTKYRQYFGISLNGNGIIVFAIYSYLVYFIHCKKRQIMNEELQRRIFEKEIGLCLIFVYPIIVGIFYSATNIIIQVSPKFAKESFAYHFSELTRYTYFIEPILTICLLREIREALKRRFYLTKITVVTPYENEKLAKKCPKVNIQCLELGVLHKSCPNNK